MVVKSDFAPEKLIFTTKSVRMGVSLHQLNQTDVVKRLYHLLLIQYILEILNENTLNEEHSHFFYPPAKAFFGSMPRIVSLLLGSHGAC